MHDKLGTMVPMANSIYPYRRARTMLRARLVTPSPIAHIALILCFFHPKAIACAVRLANANRSAEQRIMRTVPELCEYCGPIQRPMKLRPRFRCQSLITDGPRPQFSLASGWGRSTHTVQEPSSLFSVRHFCLRLPIEPRKRSPSGGKT